MGCDHTKTIHHPGRYEEDDWTGEQVWVDGETEVVTTCIDLGIHSYKCTQCGEVMYYSSRGKDICEKSGDVPLNKRGE